MKQQTHGTLWDKHFIPIPMTDAIPVTLDTGREVEIVLGDLAMLYEIGEIPDDLTPIAQRMLFAAPPKNDAGAEKRYTERFKLVKWLVVNKFLKKPVVVETPKRPGEIAANHLYRDEIWQIYNLANDPALALSTFRRQQGIDVAAVSGLQDVGEQAESEADSTAAEE